MVGFILTFKVLEKKSLTPFSGSGYGTRQHGGEFCCFLPAQVPFLLILGDTVYPDFSWELPFFHPQTLEFSGTDPIPDDITGYDSWIWQEFRTPVVL